jgi:hypothetical protein
MLRRYFFTRKKIMLKNIIFALLTLAALATSHTILAADPQVGETPPAQMLPPAAPDTEAAGQAANSTRPVNDNHVDYRYCLELKNDREIAECRYKKK